MSRIEKQAEIDTIEGIKRRYEKINEGWYLTDVGYLVTKLEQKSGRIRELEEGTRKHRNTDWQIIVEHGSENDRNLRIIEQANEELYKLLEEE